MTIEMQSALEREMEDALRIDDPSRRQDACMTVLIHQNHALVDCQRKTAERVKELVADKEKLHNMSIGFKAAIAGVVIVLTVGGPMVAMKLAQICGMFGK